MGDRPLGPHGPIGSKVSFGNDNCIFLRSLDEFCPDYLSAEHWLRLSSPCEMHPLMDGLMVICNHLMQTNQYSNLAVSNQLEKGQEAAI